MDWETIITNVTVGLIAGAASWGVGHIVKLRKDIDAAFRKIRALEKVNELCLDLDLEQNADETRD